MNIGEFKEKIIQESSHIPVLVDFWAPWCSPCQMIGPVLEDLANNSKDRWKLVKVNVDDSHEVVEAFKVRGIPAVKLFVNGTVRNEFTGALQEFQISKWIADNLPDAFEQELEEIQDILDTKPDQAKLRLEKILKKHPEHPLASLLYASIFIFEDPDKALEFVNNAKKSAKSILQAQMMEELIAINQINPEELPEGVAKDQCKKGIMCMRGKKFSEALPLFIEAVIINKNYADGLPGKACIGLFNYLGPENSLVKKYRKKFDMALY